MQSNKYNYSISLLHQRDEGIIVGFDGVIFRNGKPVLRVEKTVPSKRSKDADLPKYYGVDYNTGKYDAELAAFKLTSKIWSKETKHPQGPDGFIYALIQSYEAAHGVVHYILDDDLYTQDFIINTTVEEAAQKLKRDFQPGKVKIWNPYTLCFDNTVS